MLLSQTLHLSYLLPIGWFKDVLYLKTPLSSWNGSKYPMNFKGKPKDLRFEIPGSTMPGGGPGYPWFSSLGFEFSTNGCWSLVSLKKKMSCLAFV